MFNDFFKNNNLAGSVNRKMSEPTIRRRVTRGKNGKYFTHFRVLSSTFKLCKWGHFQYFCASARQTQIK